MIPVKTLSRKPFLLMLQDDAGVVAPVRIDPGLVASDKAVIVLDEYNDTCWAWIGRDVGMPTRMHALRMAKSLQKSGHKIKDTTIGMACSKLVEMNEKDDGDPEVASNIATFRRTIAGKWRFDDEFLAYSETGAASATPERVQIRDTATKPSEPKAPLEAKPKPRPVTMTTMPPPPAPRTAPPKPKATTTPTSEAPAEKKVAFLLYSAVKNADLVYTERFQRDGKTGVKIEAPGTMVIEALVDGENLVISPQHFGDTEEAKRIKAEYESWLAKL